MILKKPLSMYPGVEYDYKTPNLPKHEEYDPGGLVVGTTLQLHATMLRYALLDCAGSVSLSGHSLIHQQVDIFWETSFVRLNPMKFIHALIDDDTIICDFNAIAHASIEILVFAVSKESDAC
jgi:hypothetical protein